MDEKESIMSYKYNSSIIVVLYVSLLIILLQRTDGLGELIMMILHINKELYRFFFTFGSVIILFLLIYITLEQEFLVAEFSIGVLFQDLINAFNGIINFQNYTSPLG